MAIWLLNWKEFTIGPVYLLPGVLSFSIVVKTSIDVLDKVVSCRVIHGPIVLSDVSLNLKKAGQQKSYGSKDRRMLL